MYRLKIGQNVTMGDVTRGPDIVIECDFIHEVGEFLRSGALVDLIEIDRTGQIPRISKRLEKPKSPPND